MRGTPNGGKEGKAETHRALKKYATLSMEEMGDSVGKNAATDDDLLQSCEKSGTNRVR